MHSKSSRTWGKPSASSVAVGTVSPYPSSHSANSSKVSAITRAPDTGKKTLLRLPVLSISDSLKNSPRSFLQRSMWIRLLSQAI